MNQIEGVDAERARLERVAWGSALTPADAARARSALAALSNAEPDAADRTALGHEVSDSKESEVGGVGIATAAEERGAGVWRRGGRFRGTNHRVMWALGATAVVIAFVAGTAVGVSVGGRAVEPASTVTPATGAVAVDRRLEQPQTAADLPPAGIVTSMESSSARLVFTNRSLSGDDAATPWNVWAGVGRDGSTICLVASADQLEGTSACYPRRAALLGQVSLSATALSGTLTVRLVGGGVRASVVTGSEPMYTAGPVD
ncbi:hypothetical protein [Curtobacterium sp. MCPF17_051]|uniref:hypothetical protein n=1 Tax=Curtobacterium sp. MCPF17_051 TaxID=2175640 RepID=UPI000DA916B7|nr:hypothetical protein [Curtobacterium sp. MCPF17_051]